MSKVQRRADPKVRPPDTLPIAVAVADYLPSRGIKKQPPRVPVLIIKVEEPSQAARQCVKAVVAHAPRVPVIFDEVNDGSLVGDVVVHIVLLCQGRDDQDRQPGAISATCLIAAGDLSRIAAAKPRPRERIRAVCDCLIIGLITWSYQPPLSSHAKNTAVWDHSGILSSRLMNDTTNCCSSSGFE